MRLGFTALVTMLAVTPVLMASGSADALDRVRQQVLIEPLILEVGIGASRSGGDLGIEFNNRFFDSEHKSFSTTRGFVTLGVEAPGPRFGQTNVVFGARSQIFFDSQLFDVNFELPQHPNDQVRMTAKNAYNVMPFVGIDFPIDSLIGGQESQARLRILGGPTFSDQRLTVDLDAGGNHEVQSFDNVAVAPTIGVEVVATHLIVPSGQTVLLGGAFDVGIKAGGQVTFQRAVPSAGHIPLLNALFTQDRDVDASAQLLIFVTPHIVEPTDN